jgi:UDP-N-acetylmuramate--alanine ligase
MISRDISKYEYAYFLGIGGIGMSAICRYFMSIGIKVFGYDKTESALTQSLINEGAQITFTDAIASFPEVINQNTTKTIFILTPAVPDKHSHLVYLKENSIEIFKRAEVLGMISHSMFSICVAGTHGKTTTSTLIAHLFESANINYTAFLGGISANYNTNYLRKTNGESLATNGREIVVLEADEFDRSFHQLQPDLAIITAIDADHLDIYDTHRAFEDAFNHFANLIRISEYTHKTVKSGQLIIEEKLTLELTHNIGVNSYGTSPLSKYSCQNIHIKSGKFHFDFFEGQTFVSKFICGLPGFHNVSNATAALAICYGMLGMDIEKLKIGIATYKGAKRRFEYVVDNADHVVIDDYAHHPEELNAIIGSVKSLYPSKKITGIFQPHLFSRTRDFVDGFADSLSKLDELWLMEIYPAREEPIPNIDSTWLLEKVNLAQKSLVTPDSILEKLKTNKPEVLLILGAGDIDRIVSPIGKIYAEI